MRIFLCTALIFPLAVFVAYLILEAASSAEYQECGYIYCSPMDPPQ